MQNEQPIYGLTDPPCWTRWERLRLAVARLMYAVGFNNLAHRVAPGWHGWME